MMNPKLQESKKTKEVREYLEGLYQEEEETKARIDALDAAIRHLARFERTPHDHNVNFYIIKSLLSSLNESKRFEEEMLQITREDILYTLMNGLKSRGKKNSNSNSIGNDQDD